ncbi:Aldehyde reductase 1 [Verticillium dahliae VDG1]|nr:Aldehyde reductase 1 [Verticillium dahliae VDG1]
MRFSSSRIEKEKLHIDPTDQNDFTRPVTLQRRDPRQPAAGREVKPEEEEPEPEPNPEDEKEAERIAQLKAEKDAWKAMEAAKSAPAIKDPNASTRTKQPKQEDRGVQFHRAPRSEKERKQQSLRYEEALPWHIEDADGKHVWVGSYVAPLSETTVCLVPTTDGKFAMTPLEKWYKFQPKPNFTTMRIEEAEALMKQQSGVSRWHMQAQEKKAGQKDLEDWRRFKNGPSRIKTESSTFRGVSKSEKMDHDEIDFEGDEFQDDDEAPNFEPDNDEDQKESAERIKREQLGANVFGEGDEGKVDQEELETRLLEESRKREGKTINKALVKREKETIYKKDSDDEDGNRYFGPSDEEDSDDESKDGEDEANKKDEDKASSQDPSAQSQDANGAKDKDANSKGTLTPSGKQKEADATRKGKSLKRPGSPNLSESSETESTLRKKKLKKNGSSVQVSRSGTPLPSGHKHKVGMSSMSDGEATGGEMSDGQQRKKKIKLLGTGARGTPTGSRAGSPAPAGAAGSASPTSPNPRAGSPSRSGPIEPWEVFAALPPQGISSKELNRRFNERIGDGPGQTSKAGWINIVKDVAVFGRDKLLRPKEGAAPKRD